MNTVTYSTDQVIEAVQEFFVPVKIDGEQRPEIAQLFQTQVTPIAIVTDSKHKSYHRKEGFQPPEDFLHTLRLMASLYYLERRKYDEAISLLTKVLEEGFGSTATAESLYHLGVAKYKKSGDFQQAVEQWRRLKLTYPNHPLLKKVDYAL
jgi:tetratricopeptide (TPR) repeat protein